MFRKRRATLLLLAPIVLGGSTAAAQTLGKIRGIVIALESGQPLVGARVSVIGSDVQFETDTAGIFEISELSAGEFVLRFEVDGRPRTVERVVVEAGRVTGGVFEMPHATHVLDALNVSRSSAPSAGSVIRPDEALGGRNRSIGDLLNDVSGVQLIRGSGQVGQRYSLRIRGVRSFLFNGPPAVYVDGIRVSERLGTGGVLDLLTTQDIGSVEVLRGPAAATVYGASASNGVILVTTRRGRG